MIRTVDLLQALTTDIKNTTGYTNVRVGVPLGKSTTEPTIYVYPANKNIVIHLSHFSEEYSINITVERVITVPEDDILVWNIMDDIMSMFTDRMYTLRVGTEEGIVSTLTWDYRSFTQANNLLRWGTVLVAFKFAEH